MYEPSVSSRKHLVGARLFGLVAGGLVVCLLLASLIKPHQWLAFRQAIPLSMSLAEAERGFDSVTQQTRDQIANIHDQALRLSDDAPSTTLAQRLREQAAGLRTLEDQSTVAERQLEIYKDAFEQELIGWTEELEGLKDNRARLDAQTRTLKYQATFEQRVHQAERDLSFVKSVLEDGEDIKRLVAMAEHENNIRTTLEDMESLTSEVTTFARTLEATTKSVLVNWADRP